MTRRRSAALLFTTLALLLAACGSSGEDDGAPTTEVEATTGVGAETPTTGSGSVASSVLECEQLGFPCSLADVPVEILGRSSDLLVEANERLDAGDDMAAVASWLQGLDDVLEVEADEQAVRFRVDGGRGVWLLGDGLSGSRSAGAPTASRAGSHLTGSPRRYKNTHRDGHRDDSRRHQHTGVVRPSADHERPRDEGRSTRQRSHDPDDSLMASVGVAEQPDRWHEHKRHQSAHDTRERTEHPRNGSFGQPTRSGAR